MITAIRADENRSREDLMPVYRSRRIPHALGAPSNDAEVLRVAVDEFKERYNHH